MSNVSSCPTCGSKSKVKEIDGETVYQTLQEDEIIKKVGQMKKAMQKFKEKAERLEQELAELKSK
jgi:uncharacterized Zn finger protein (UPF0148 family)